MCYHLKLYTHSSGNAMLENSENLFKVLILENHPAQKKASNFYIYEQGIWKWQSVYLALISRKGRSTFLFYPNTIM